MTKEAVIKIVLDEAFHVHKKIELACWKACIKPVWHIGYKSEDYFWKRKSQCLLLPVN